MAGLLDQAPAPTRQDILRGLLQDEKSVAYRGGVLPYLLRTVTDPIDDVSEYEQPEWATPGLLHEPFINMAQTGAMLAGDMSVDPRPMTAAMVDTPLIGGLLGVATGAAPRGAVLGANVLPSRLLDDVGIETTQRGNVLEITKIETPDNLRGQGLADQRLEQLIQQADADGTTLALTPSNAFGANKSRLTKWYKRHGFVPNKGRNKDFATRESMVRPPGNIELGANKAPTAALPGLLGKVLDKRAQQMLLPPAERLQPSGQGVMDLSPEAYVRDTPQFSDDLMADIPRQVEGKTLPKAGRSQVIVDNMDDIANVLADRARSQMGTETQYFYHTGPIYEAARKAGLSKKEAGEFMRDFSDAYAATSPRTPTEPNLRSASLVMAKDAAGIPFDTVVGPNAGRGLNETGYPMMIQNKGDISSKGKPATQTGIHKLLLQELQRSGKINKDTNPKPATFARNVEGNLSAPTIDTHAIRGALDALNELQPGAIPKGFIKPKFRKQYDEDPSSFNAATMVDDTLASAQVGGTKKQVEYAPFADLYKLMADKLGVSPAEAQSMGWFGSGAKTGLASEAKSVARLIDERIDVTAQALGVTSKEAARMFFRREIPLMANPITAAIPGLLEDKRGLSDFINYGGSDKRQRRGPHKVRGLLGGTLYEATTPDGFI